MTGNGELPNGVDFMQRREDLGLSRAELAAKAGVTTTTIWRYESGKYKPNVSTMSKLMRALTAHAEEPPDDDTNARLVRIIEAQARTIEMLVDQLGRS